MRKPSSLLDFIADLPPDLAQVAVSVIAEEYLRWMEGRLTDEEKESMQTASDLGLSMQQILSDTILELIAKDKANV